MGQHGEWSSVLAREARGYDIIPEDIAYDSQDDSDRVRDRAGRLYDALVRLHDAQRDFKRKVADLRELMSRQQVQELVERYLKEIRS